MNRFRPSNKISNTTRYNKTCDPLNRKCKHFNNEEGTWTKYPCAKCRRNYHLRTHIRRDCKDLYEEN